VNSPAEADPPRTPVAWAFDCPVCGALVGERCEFSTATKPVDERVCHFARERIARFGSEHDQAVKDRCAEAAAREIRRAADVAMLPEVKTALSGLLLQLPELIREA
jgi:hypothetical protein